MRAILERRGDGVYIRIPASVPRSAKLRVGEPVHVREQCGAIVIEPIGRKEYSIEKLIEEMTPESLHEEIVAGGNE
jgi:antitoxin MazE